MEVQQLPTPANSGTQMQNNQMYPEMPAGAQTMPGAPFPPDIGLSSDDLIRIKNESEKAKKISGYFLLFLITILFIGAQVLNSLYLRSSSVALWSTIVYVVFLFAILSSKFDLIDKIIAKTFPYLKEPEDFLKQVKER